MSTAARFAAAYAVLTAAHEVGDYWVQRDAEAVAKGRHGHEGRLACARHVASYTATQGVALLAADRAFGLGLAPGRSRVGGVGGDALRRGPVGRAVA
jgi:hypothetical protein